MALDKQIKRLQRKVNLAVSSSEGNAEGSEYIEVERGIWKNSDGAKVCSMTLELEALCFERQRIASGCFDPVFPRTAPENLLQNQIQQSVQGKSVKQYMGRETMTPVQIQPTQSWKLEPPFFQVFPHSHHSPSKPPSIRVNDPLQLSPFDTAAMRPSYAAPAHGGLLDMNMSEQSEVYMSENTMLNIGHNNQMDVHGNDKCSEYSNPTLLFSQYMNDTMVREGKHSAVHSQKNGTGNVPSNVLVESRSIGREELDIKGLAPIDTNNLVISPLGMPGVNKLMPSPFLTLNGNTIWVSPGNGSMVTTPQFGRKQHFELLPTPKTASNNIGSGINDCSSVFTSSDDTTTTGILSDSPGNSIGAEVQGWNISTVVSPQLSNIFLFSPPPISSYHEKFVL
eukprot:281259_1